MAEVGREIRDVTHEQINHFCANERFEWVLQSIAFNVSLLLFLTGECSAGRGVEAVAAVSAVAAGDVIVRVLRCREWRAVVHLFISSFEAEGRTCLHGNSVSEGHRAAGGEPRTTHSLTVNHDT